VLCSASSANTAAADRHVLRWVVGSEQSKVCGMVNDLFDV
jgi:hypothetical protein